MMRYFLWLALAFLFSACGNNSKPEIKNNQTSKPAITILTVDPGHFHAALVQKSMYDKVDTNVYVYSPGGNDLDLHQGRIKSYNTRTEAPTHWNQVVYTGVDFFEKMISEKKGNLVVLSGNNKVKTDYIYKSLDAGLHVFADKPMVINSTDFEKLKAAFAMAKQKNVQLYDIMTERYEVTTMLQRLFSMNKELFGDLQKGSIDKPAITKESIHHFYKFVSGNVLVRPQWFMDINQQGEGLVDVMTHLVDLVQWECFPDQIIDTNNIKINNAKRWATKMTSSEFNTITKANGFPEYLKSAITNDTILNVFSNGEVNYTINGIHAKTSVIWNYKAPDGTGDTHYSIMRGTVADLEIRQGKDENFKPVLYINPITKKDISSIVDAEIKKHDQQFPGIAFEKTTNGYKVILPAAVQVGHEAHFAQVMEKYLEYLINNNMPAWEVPNMISKYYTTTKALSLAHTPQK